MRRRRRGGSWALGVGAAVLFVALGEAGVACAGEGPVEITLDGKQATVWARSVDGEGGPVGPGDLLRIGRLWWVSRGSDERLVFRQSSGRLWRTGADGKERLVGAVAATGPAGEVTEHGLQDGSTFHSGRKAEPDTFSALSGEEVAGLRCVRVVRPDAAMTARLGKLDLEQAVLVGAGAESDPVPGLPPGTRFLILGEGPSNQGPTDLSALSGLSDLRLLVLGSRYSDPTDLAPLAGLSRLRVLDVSWRNLVHPESLARLEQLRDLSVAGCDELVSLDWARSLMRLRRLVLCYSGITDLAPLADLPTLEVLDAHGDREPSLGAPPRHLTTLPAGRWPALKTFRLIGSRVPPDAIVAFGKAHPSCDVVWSGMAALRKGLEGIDRLRVRSGGTCHRSRRSETTEFETRERTEIAEFLDLLRFRFPEFHGPCQCCGGPTLEFYAGENVRAAIGVHHGQGLRWADGEWPGDAALEEASAEAMANWLAARGVTGPRADIEEARRADAARRHQAERERALLPPTLRTRYADRDPWVRADEELPLIREAVPEASARVLLALRLLGVKAPRGNESGASQAARFVLSDTAPGNVVAVASAALDDAEVCRGLGRWLGRANLPDDALDRVLPRVAAAFLDDPAPEVQRQGIDLVAEYRLPSAVPVLVRWVEGPSSRMLREKTIGDGWVFDTGWAAVEALIDTGDPDVARRVRKQAAAWPAVRQEAAEARMRRVAREVELLPAGLRKALHDAGRTRRPASEALAAAFPDEAHRILLAFRLVAITDRRRPDAVSSAAGETLERAAPVALVEAARKGLDDDEVATGIGWWILDGRRVKDLDPTLVSEFLARAGPRLLAIRDGHRRREAMEKIASVPGSVSVALLRGVLPTSGAAAANRGPFDEDDVRGAVFCLLRLRDRESLPRLREIAATWDEDLRARFETAVAEWDEREER